LPLPLLLPVLLFVVPQGSAVAAAVCFPRHNPGNTNHLPPPTPKFPHKTTCQAPSPHKPSPINKIQMRESYPPSITIKQEAKKSNQPQKNNNPFI
jgi:hypothetical protein